MKFIYRIGLIAAVYMLIMGAGNIALASLNLEEVQVTPGSCTDYDTVKAYFERQGATRIWTGLSVDGAGAAALFVNEDHWWLIVTRAADGYTCMRLDGDEHWLLKPPVEGDDS